WVIPGPTMTTRCSRLRQTHSLARWLVCRSHSATSSTKSSKPGALDVNDTKMKGGKVNGSSASRSFITHHVTYCVSCKDVIDACRCPAPDKEVRWDTCTACKAAEAEGGVVPALDEDQLTRIRSAIEEAVRMGITQALRDLASELEKNN